MQFYSRSDLLGAWIVRRSLLCVRFNWRAIDSMKVKEVIRVLKAHGFQLDRMRGSHRQFEGMIDEKRRLVTVSGKPNQEVGRNIMGSIRRQSGLPPSAFRQEMAGK